MDTEYAASAAFAGPSPHHSQERAESEPASLRCTGASRTTARTKLQVTKGIEGGATRGTVDVVLELAYLLELIAPLPSLSPKLKCGGAFYVWMSS